MTRIHASASVVGRIAVNTESTSVIRSVALPQSRAALRNPTRQSCLSENVVRYHKHTNAMIGSAIRRKETDSTGIVGRVHRGSKYRSSSTCLVLCRYFSGLSRVDAELVSIGGHNDSFEQAPKFLGATPRVPATNEPGKPRMDLVERHTITAIVPAGRSHRNFTPGKRSQ